MRLSKPVTIYSKIKLTDGIQYEVEDEFRTERQLMDFVETILNKRSKNYRFNDEDRCYISRADIFMNNKNVEYVVKFGASE